MIKYAHLQTGVGTNFTSSTYYGPLEEGRSADEFVVKVREEFGKLSQTSSMGISLIDEVPEGRAAIAPEDFKGFMKLE